MSDRGIDPRDYIEAALGIPFTQGNRVEVLKNGDQIFPAMLAAINGAQHSILFETYVYWKGNIAQRFADALARKAKEGVTVRVLLDAYGSSRMDESLIDQIRNAGGKVRLFRPLRWRIWDFDKRTHRKILVCDQRIGFTGGVGIASEWEGDARNPSEWRETHFRFEGDAVQGLSGAFWNNWIDIDGEYLPDAFRGEPESVDGQSLALVARSAPATHQSEMELVFECLLILARASITLTTPYFNIGPKTVNLLIEKAKAGVQIEILIPGKHIDRSFELLVAEECIQPLLEANISIRRYQRTMLHAKVIRVDDDIACVGSPNFNQRSRKKDFEVAVILKDKQVAETLDSHYRDDLAQSEPIKAGDIKKAGLIRKLGRKAVLLFREQL